MDEQQQAHQQGNHTEEFLATGRTGRRNAVGDITDEKTAYTSTAELPSALSRLSFDESDKTSTSASGSDTVSKDANGETSSAASTQQTSSG